MAKRNILNLLHLDIYELHQKKSPALKNKEKQNFDIPESK